MYKILGAVGFILILCLLMLIKPVSDTVGKWTGVAGDKLRSIAETVAGVCVGVFLCVFGLMVVGTLPIIGIVSVVAGLGILAWNLLPLFKRSTVSMTTNGGR